VSWRASGLLDFYTQRILELTGDGELAALHDPCAVLAVTHPELFDFAKHRVRIELDGTHARGMTVIDQRVDKGPSRSLGGSMPSLRSS